MVHSSLSILRPPTTMTRGSGFLWRRGLYPGPVVITDGTRKGFRTVQTHGPSRSTILHHSRDRHYSSIFEFLHWSERGPVH